MSTQRSCRQHRTLLCVLSPKLENTISPHLLYSLIKLHRLPNAYIEVRSHSTATLPCIDYQISSLCTHNLKSSSTEPLAAPNLLALLRPTILVGGFIVLDQLYGTGLAQKIQASSNSRSHNIFAKKLNARRFARRPHRWRNRMIRFFALDIRHVYLLTYLTALN